MPDPTPITPVCDDARHLICEPYSVENLHTVAARLGIKRCWYHAGSAYPHYDIPKRRIAEIMAQCRVVTQRETLRIISAAGYGALAKMRMP